MDTPMAVDTRASGERNEPRRDSGCPGRSVCRCVTKRGGPHGMWQTPHCFLPRTRPISLPGSALPVHGGRCPRPHQLRVAGAPLIPRLRRNPPSSGLWAGVGLCGACRAGAGHGWRGAPGGLPAPFGRAPLSAGCSSTGENPLTVFADPGKYQFSSCEQLAGQRKYWSSRRGIAASHG